MKSIGIVAVSVLATMIIGVIISLNLLSAQTDLILPDYTQWEKTASGNINAIVDGKTSILLAETYEKTDLALLRRYLLNVLYNEQDKPWLAFLTEETGEERPDGSVVTKESYYYLFENTNGQWKFVKNFSKSQNVDQEFADLLKARYKLEVK
ncbi:MAG: hypothetical protein Q8Q89_02600 [bacterium]|nr:hypothetical protein [bacterium]